MKLRKVFALKEPIRIFVGDTLRVTYTQEGFVSDLANRLGLRRNPVKVKDWSTGDIPFKKNLTVNRVEIYEIEKDEYGFSEAIAVFIGDKDKEEIVMEEEGAVI